MREKIILYMHGGSGNHGCEAIVRTVASVIKEKPVLYSAAPEEDVKYGLSNFCDVKGQKKPSTLRTRLKIKLGCIDDLETAYGNLMKCKGTALSIGGDVYCYEIDREHIIRVNEKLRSNGCKTALIGCSINPELLSRRTLVKDLKGYELITARESVTYNALINAGIDKNVKLIPDSAFLLKAEKTLLPDIFDGKDVVGINLSPLLFDFADKESILAAYGELINFIYEKTDFSVALIPHVVKQNNDDRDALALLYDMCDDKNRVVTIEDMSVGKLKFIISKCRFFIGARTHAIIAAYSSRVPAVALGYSVKAKGIACDLFGTDKGYVIDARALENKEELKNAFVTLTENEEKIRDMLNDKIPFIEREAMRLSDALKEMV